MTRALYMAIAPGDIVYTDVDYGEILQKLTYKATTFEVCDEVCANNFFFSLHVEVDW
jgi:hypothetical protein